MAAHNLGPRLPCTHVPHAKQLVSAPNFAKDGAAVDLGRHFGRKSGWGSSPLVVTGDHIGPTDAVCLVSSGYRRPRAHWARRDTGFDLLCLPTIIRSPPSRRRRQKRCGAVASGFETHTVSKIGSPVSSSTLSERLRLNIPPLAKQSRIAAVIALDVADAHLWTSCDSALHLFLTVHFMLRHGLRGRSQQGTAGAGCLS